MAQVRTFVDPNPADPDRVEVVFLNETGEPQSFEPPAVVAAAGEAGRELIRSDDGPSDRFTIPPRGFVKLVYVRRDLQWPGAAATVSSAHADAPDPGPGTAPDRERIRSTLANLESHEPSFFIAGGASDSVKVQFSFAVPLADLGPTTFRFAYTQTMMWALELPSGPFTATTYSPEGFFTIPLGVGRRPLELELGARHDSTGEAGRSSRDVNRAFARLSIPIALGDDWSLRAEPMAWFYFFTEGFPPARGIEDYWGYASLRMVLEQEGGLQLAGTARGSLDTGFAAAEINASYPIHSLGRGWPRIYLFGQLFSGYGESLLGYDEERTRLRFGIGFSR